MDERAGDDEPYLYALMRGRADPAGLSQDTVPGVIDLGHDVRVMLTAAENGARTGFLESHPRPDGTPCGGGAVTFDVPEAEGLKGPRWTLVSVDPLHIEPSVLCRTCGHHGFVRSGHWVPA